MDYITILQDLKSRITSPEGHLLDRNTIAAELDKALAAEASHAHHMSDPRRAGKNLAMAVAFLEAIDKGKNGMIAGPGYVVLSTAEYQKVLKEIHQLRVGKIEELLPEEKNKDTLSKVFDELRAERQRQDSKWGEQNHDMADYYTILGEEVGEVGKAICEHKLKTPSEPAVHIREELVQTAAVSVAMIECFDRKEAK